MGRRLCLAVAFAGCGFRGAPLSEGQGADDAAPGADVAPTSDAMGSGADAATASVDSSLDAPVASATPIDCLDAYQHGTTTSGALMIDPDGANQGNPPFSVYCDMTTAGGGWTLVWVYAFANYGSFASSSNGVTPHPTWDTPTSSTPTSTTPPLDPTTTGAVDFARWRTLGTEVLVTSNINHWVKCQPGAGSLVSLTTGTMTCQMVQVVASACQTTVPSYFDATDPQGPGLQTGPAYLDTYYYWEGSTGGGWPTHDPCGHNGTNQVTGVSNPRGRIYVRRQ